MVELSVRAARFMTQIEAKGNRCVKTLSDVPCLNSTIASYGLVVNRLQQFIQTLFLWKQTGLLLV